MAGFVPVLVMDMRSISSSRCPDKTLGVLVLCRILWAKCTLHIYQWLIVMRLDCQLKKLRSAQEVCPQFADVTYSTTSDMGGGGCWWNQFLQSLGRQSVMVWSSNCSRQDVQFSTTQFQCFSLENSITNSYNPPDPPDHTSQSFHKAKVSVLRNHSCDATLAYLDISY